MLYGYSDAVITGAVVTIKVAFGALIIAFVLGLATAAAGTSRNGVLIAVAKTYTSLARCAPDFVWLLFLYYGGQALLNTVVEKVSPDTHVDIDAFTASVTILGLVYGGYLAETFRGAILAVSKGQMEAGYAFGLRRSTVMFRILFPQMMRFALPGISNNWLVLVKASAITSMVSLNELVFLSTAAGRATHHLLIFFCVAGLVYLTITSVSLWLLRGLNHRYSLGTREVVL